MNLKNTILKISNLLIITILFVGFFTPFFIQASVLSDEGKKTPTKSHTLTDSDAMKSSIDAETSLQGVSSDGNAVYTLIENSLPGVKSDNLGVYLEGIFTLAIGIATALAVLMIVIGGFKYMTSEVAFSKTDAVSQINGAILGLVLVLASWLILSTINTDLVNFSTKLTPVEFTATPDDTSTEDTTGVTEEAVTGNTLFKLDE